MAAAEDSTTTETLITQSTSLPDYINFLLSPDTPLDFHVNVGNPKISPQERIGAVKWMLIARSRKLRARLLENEIKHDKEMTITDLDPDTFKNLLVFMYGHDNTSTLEFKAAVSLLRAAGKYDVKDLKYKLAEIITPQVTVDKLFLILQEGYVCETVPELWETANETEPLITKSSSLPDYINFLLSPDTPLDFHVNVGNPKISPQERIGAVKWMLIARSRKLRARLLENEIKHDKEMTITDLDPDTFKNLLVFVYGHDNTSTLEFKAAVSLLGAAEKYDVKDLKYKLAEMITAQVTVDNVFVILQEGYVCETVPELWETANEIVQCHTEDLFSNAQFPRVRPEVLLHIVQQEALSVPEVEVWRAALNWATHQVEPVDGVISAENLRMTILPFLKHIHLCAMSTDDLVKEVLGEEILTTQELRVVSRSYAGDTDSHSSAQICTITEERRRSGKLKMFTQKGDLTDWSYGADIILDLTDYSRGSGIELTTKGSDIELCSVECKAGRSAQYDITISILALSVTDPVHNVSREVKFSKFLEAGADFVIDLTHNNKPIVLKANSKYKIEFSSSQCLWMFSYDSPDESYQTTDSFDVRFIQCGIGWFCSPIIRFHYKKCT